MSLIVVLAGEGEYGSSETMKLYAQDQLDAGHRVEFRTPDVLADFPDFPASSFGDLEALSEADLLVVYTRFRRLPDSEMEWLDHYVAAHRPVIGLRTSTHAFAFPEGSRWESWNDGFGQDVLGSPWVSHHGHLSTTVVRAVGDVGHPILDGVPREFPSPSWLYRVEQAVDCVDLLWGEPIDTNDGIPTPGPAGWVRDASRRTFMTTLGHPDDFHEGPLRRLLSNATSWCLR